MPFEILFPLIRETLEKIEKNKPSKIQTGPAIRKDMNTIKKHLNFIKSKNSKNILYINGWNNRKKWKIKITKSYLKRSQPLY